MVDAHEDLAPIDKADGKAASAPVAGVGAVESTVKLAEVLPEEKPRNTSLLNVRQVDGGFVVTMPGAYLIKGEGILPMDVRFTTQEEAEQAAAEAWKKAGDYFEGKSLEKSFIDGLYSIGKTEDGKFRVKLPGLKELSTGNYVGTTFFDFDNWEEARDFYLRDREQEEKLTSKPLLELQVDEGTRIAFSDLDAFHPRITPSETVHDIPPAIERYLIDKMSQSPATYQETIKEEGWEKKLYGFVSSYLAGAGAEMAERLKIKNLDSLTPKQAIELSTQIVVSLTKYYSKSKLNQTQAGDDLDADKSTTLQLLREGLAVRSQGQQAWNNWDGNGVCRNFGGMVQAVFQSLKANQTRFSQLRDTYCLYDSSASDGAYAPKREDRSHFSTDRIGHAWNTFITISRGSANVTIVDTTWPKRNLETKEVTGLDYTLTRMEPIVYAIAQDIKQDAPDKEEQLKHILSFYELKIRTPGKLGGHGTEGQERQFYATRALDLMTHHGVPAELPGSLVEELVQEYIKTENIERSEIGTLYRIFQNNPAVNFNDILEHYISDKHSHAGQYLIFTDDSLQNLVLEKLKSSRYFDEFLKDSAFRVRIREVAPQLLGDFSPTTKPEDSEELRYLASRDGQLSAMSPFSVGQTASEEQVKRFFAKVRQKLRDLNPEGYNDTCRLMGDYQLVKQYHRLYKELKG